MIKILHFITDTNIGGAGNLLYQQIKGINYKNFHITVALPKDSALIKKLSPLPCQIITLNHGANRSFSFESIIENYKTIEKVHPDIVHSHGSLSSRIAAGIFKIPCRVFTRHCAPPIPKYMKNPLSKWTFGKINDVLSTSIIAVSPYTKKYLIELGCDENKIKTIMNGCAPLRYLSDDEKEFLRTKYGLTKENFVISYFARLEEIKGHKTLLQAAKICKNKHPNLRLFIVGIGSYEEILKKYATEIGINDIVHFVGFCDDVAPIFNITDVNVNCSYISETASLSLSEGMSIGIPSIVSNTCGNPYMVKSEENGLLFPTQNANALANAIIRLYKDKNLYQKCSLGAYKRYREELNDKIMCKEMTRFYFMEIEKSKYRKKLNPLYSNR